MFERDFEVFAALLDDCSVLLGKPNVNSRQAVLFFRTLAAHSIEDVTGAFEAHLRDPQRGRFFPAPADILAQLSKASESDGRPGPDEAWAIALRASDEAATVVWTAEISRAWGVCKPVLDGGDQVGARMAFRDAYNRIVQEARASREPISWSPTIGHDLSMRDETLTLAVEQGRLPRAYLPAPVGPVAGLIELTGVRGMPESVRERLHEIRRQLCGLAPAVDSLDLRGKERTKSLQREADAAVRRFLEGGK